ncbi:autotransporter outer membrane beta-barrel domain-containing protein [Rhodopila sp.]|uniref:autotransporter outer membrane beta-barrel domain-containing protein n=1 Tax=Rhodopila sp. TaxID=2480087 RepID=UPI002BFF5B7D|nr:autotransporter outer membrane beta-barrel domain-containing protein [Rhodopila sp.]HVZ10021.1 autotransporter outer membrane beta-barrel domain-containing protein [Rhodopila sp.]
MPRHLHAVALITALLAGGLAAHDAHSQTTPFPPGQVVIGPIGNTDGPTLPALTTGADANLYTGSVEGGFVPNAPAQVVRTSVPTQFVRFYKQNNDLTLGPAVGSWIATSNSVRGLTAAQVKNILALPDLPTSVAIVRVPAGTCILGGPGNPALGNFPADPPAVPTPGPWGAAGAPQYYIVGQTTTPDCVNPQYIDTSNYIPQSNMGTYALAYVPNARSGNTAAVAAALDHAIFPAPFTPMDGVYNSLDFLNFTDPVAFRNALSQLSGEINADLPSVTLEAARSFLGILQQHLQADTSPAVQESGGLRLWLGTGGGDTNVAGDGNTHDFGMSMVGVVGGVEAALSPQVLVGGALGYAHTSLSLDGLASGGSADSYSMAVYGRYSNGPFYTQGIIGYGFNNFAVGRSLAFADQVGSTTTDTNSRAFMSSIDIGYRFPVWAGGSIAPVAGLQVISQWQNAFSEYGAGALDLNADSKSLTSVRGLLGIDVRHHVTVNSSLGLTADLRLSWAHDFAGTARDLDQSFQELSSAAFQVHGAGFSRDAAVIGLGVTTTGPVRMFIRYDGEYSGAQLSNGGMIGVSTIF